MESIEKQSLFESLPPVRDMAAVTEQYAALFADREDYCVVVLDDDPTGIQTVHGIPVYMNWQEADVDAAVRDEPVFYVQTNTRGEVESACREINRVLAARLAQAARRQDPVYRQPQRFHAALALSAGDADAARDPDGGRPARL